MEAAKLFFNPMFRLSRPMLKNVGIPSLYGPVHRPQPFIPSPTPQVLFKRRLSGRQWFSLLLLTLGCVIKQLNFGGPAATQSGKAWHEGLFSVNLLLILVQVSVVMSVSSVGIGLTGHHRQPGRKQGGILDRHQTTNEAGAVAHLVVRRSSRSLHQKWLFVMSFTLRLSARCSVPALPGFITNTC